MSISLLICIIGVILYFAFSTREPRVAECGRIMFAFGLLVTLLGLAATRVF